MHSTSGYMTFCLCLCLFQLRIQIHAQSIKTSISLMEKLLDGYDRRQRPVLDQSQPINVNISFDLIAIRDFDELAEKFSVIGILYLTWFDEVLRWNPWLYEGSISQRFPLYDVWYPPMALTNPYDSIEDVANPDWMTVRIYANGYALFTPGTVFRATCAVDVTFYPFDTQTCDLYFAPWGYAPDEVTLTPSAERVLQTYYSENGEWTFLESVLFTVPGLNTVGIRFKFRRKPMFLAINVILPIMLMSIINILVFLVPAKSGERISYAITVLLALAVFLTLVGDNLPKTSQPLAVLSFYLMASLMTSVVICSVAILNMNVYFRSKKIPVPGWCVFVTRFIQCMCLTKKSRTENRITPVLIMNVNVVDLDDHDRGTRDAADMTDTQKYTTTTSTINNNNNKDDTEAAVACSWKEVGGAVDKICLIFFSLTIFTVNVVFIVYMTGQ